MENDYEMSKKIVSSHWIWMLVIAVLAIGAGITLVILDYIKGT